MSPVLSTPTRRGVLAGSAAAGAVSLLPAQLAVAAEAGAAPPGQPSNQGDSSMGTVEDNAIGPLPIQRVR